MAAVSNKRSVMTMYSDPRSIYSHRVRMVLAEKNITVAIEDVEPGELPEDLIELNPYNTVPTLLDRGLVLYQSRIIMEYLDERFPHPPLLPVDPVSRARSRLLQYRVDRDWYRLADLIDSSGDKTILTKARKELRDSLSVTAPVFAAKPFFMSDDLTLVDCSIAPLLWRLPALEVNLPNQAKAITEYGRRLFARESFRNSLSEVESEMRD